MPRVSVIIPTYNCVRFIGRALQSAFAQTYRDYEIVVADDGSTDGTRELLEPWYGRIVYAYQPNRGLSSARNLAASKASGEYLAYLDSDDMWFPEKLERQVAFLDRHPRCGFVHSDVTIVDEEDNVIYNSFSKDTRRPVPQGMCVLDLLQRSHIQVPSVVERRSCYDKTGGFEERLRSVEDYLQWIQVAADGNAVGYMPEPLAMYRWRNGSLSGNSVKMAEALSQMFRILLEETAWAPDVAAAAQEILRRRLAENERYLPYLYRSHGRNDLALRQAVALISESPLRLAGYADLLKSTVPVPIANTVRRLRD